MPTEHKRLIVTAEYGTYAKITVLMAIHNQALTVTIKKSLSADIKVPHTTLQHRN